MTTPRPPASDSKSPTPAPDLWTWRVKDQASNSELGLLYEPGNWGDVLKGTWALILTEHLVRPGKPFRCVDSFAGASTYPLPDGCLERWRSVGAQAFIDAQKPFLASKRIASSGKLVLCRAREIAGEDASLAVFDLDAKRLSTWDDEPCVRRLRIRTGDDITNDRSTDDGAGDDGLRDDGVDLRIVDPYDFFDRWADSLPALLEAARWGWVLIYIYNKAPRGGGYERNYRSLRRRLEKDAPASLLIGRCPADSTLPRAYHEVLLLGPRPLGTALVDRLVDTARQLTAGIASLGAAEVMGMTDETRLLGIRPPDGDS